MSQAACKQAMCIGWPEPAAIPPAQSREKKAHEEAMRGILAGWAYLSVAEQYKENPDWIAMIEAVGHTPMSDEQIQVAHDYIHRLAGM